MKLIAPRVATQAPIRSDSGRITGRLPDDLQSEQIERLAVFSALIAALWTFGLAMTMLAVPYVLGLPRQPADIVIELIGVVVSAAMCLYVRRANHSFDTKASVGLLFMIANAVGVAFLNTLAMAIWKPLGPQVSWTAVLILIYSMIAPATPRRMLAASLVAASMDPLITSLAYFRGLPALPPLTAFIHYLPNYISAIVAMVPSHLFLRLGRRLREAQDLGSYHLVELLGRGGMGEVWRAEHRLLARSAAIKLVRPELLGAGSDADARTVLRRFEREARATAQLTSPHTIQVFDYGQTNDTSFYYVMELLSGRDLESLVKEFGPVPADRAIFLLRQVCHSLADAHARGLVHRDVKPANIYLCRMGLEYDFVKVLDFGLVKYRDPGSMQQSFMTLDHQTTGTPAYMAPEIVLGEGEVDRRADVYALGCVAYYLLTGQLVFEADTPMKMLMQHVQSVPLAPSQRTELPIPPELDAIVLACLHKDPDKRPQNAEEMLRIVRNCRTCEGWTQAAARSWWEKHLPELTGPLRLRDDGPRTAGVSAAAVH
ncbi:MAG: serine/threonine-protein kinase [Acidobacteriota bacterium]